LIRAPFAASWPASISPGAYVKAGTDIVRLETQFDQVDFASGKLFVENPPNQESP